ncbi:hypothetical protein F444_07039 [Phytophthora nicotianae P1976]|nr:hypothetical protein F444_07039 [Phytophthora nicotianae P1976]
MSIIDGIIASRQDTHDPRCLKGRAIVASSSTWRSDTLPSSGKKATIGADSLGWYCHLVPAARILPVPLLQSCRRV